jgi:hypothetical protein
MSKNVIIISSVILMSISLTLILYSPIIPLLAPKICVGDTSKAGGVNESRCGIFIRSECLQNYNQQYITEKQLDEAKKKAGADFDVTKLLPVIGSQNIDDIGFNNENDDLCRLDKVHDYHKKFKTYSIVLISIFSSMFLMSLCLLIYGIRMKH